MKVLLSFIYQIITFILIFVPLVVGFLFGFIAYGFKAGIDANNQLRQKVDKILSDYNKGV